APRSSSTSCSSTTASTATTAGPRPTRRRTSTRHHEHHENPMSARAEGISVQAWGARAGRLGLGHFDLQLTVYALALVACGLLMAFSNSYYDSPSPLQPGSLFTRGLLWLVLAALAYVLATGFNYTWIR